MQKPSEPRPIVYLIPSFLAEENFDSIPPAVLKAVKACQVFFVENERTARRYLKSLDREIIIDNYEWFTIHSAEEQQRSAFKARLKQGKTIGIISEAGCPGIADPGQLLVEVAQEMNAIVKPLVGPNSILLALMASGMNGQEFHFVGYLPIREEERVRTLNSIETLSARNISTQIFIETPYRNNQLLETVLKTCRSSTRLCIACNLTAPDEWVRTKTIGEWKQQKPDLHKKPVIFCLQAIAPR
jgi:16S rRNA (cytidine1402-2'-O)-methyltransferase